MPENIDCNGLLNDVSESKDGVGLHRHSSDPPTRQVNYRSKHVKERYRHKTVTVHVKAIP